MSNAALTSLYLNSSRSGTLDEKIRRAVKKMEDCSVCPRNCGVNRLNEEKGFCSSGRMPEISSYAPHFGEERPLVGRYGSGTIFFTHCNLGCRFCQNYDISHGGGGRPVTISQLSRMMISLQESGCHNINFVSPSHFVPQILEALPGAIEMGLSVPLVYNTGGYDSLETLSLLDGIFDIYMPDIKFSERAISDELAGAPDYPSVIRAAVREMHRQVGDLIMDEEGIARRGLLVRHLVLPQGLAGTKEVMHFLASEISRETYVNIMDQYYPCGNIPVSSPLTRRITAAEYIAAVQAAHDMGIHRLDK